MADIHTIKDHDADRIISGILADADAEVANMIATAEEQAASNLARANEQATTILREARERVAAQVAAIQADAIARMATERRRISLRRQEEQIRTLENQVRQHLAGLTSQAGYADILRAWIVEAAIGLSVAAASVNASLAELPLINATLLRAAAADILAQTGKAVSLRRVDGDPLPGQGVYLVADGGRLAYDNRVAARMDRYRSAIRRIIHSTLFGSGGTKTVGAAAPATASGAEATVSGAEATASGAEATASGAEATASGAEATVSGAEATASGPGATSAFGAAS
jgi:vacuolar-type H+-ATPase subunit E/Vma4